MATWEQNFVLLNRVGYKVTSTQAVIHVITIALCSNYVLMTAISVSFTKLKNLVLAMFPVRRVERNFR